MGRFVRVGVVMTAALATVSMAVAAPVEEHRVFTDPVNDGVPLGPDFTPPYQDLVAGYISETDEAIEFTWQVVDIEDMATNRVAIFHWEFAIGSSPATVAPCTDAGNRCFSIRGAFDLEGAGRGALESNCEGTPVVDCEVLDAEVSVSIDPDANTVTASVLRADLGDPQDGEVLVAVTLFQGIAAFTRLGVPAEGDTTRPLHRPVTQPVLDTINDTSPVGVPPSVVCSCAMDAVQEPVDDYVFGTNRA